MSFIQVYVYSFEEEAEQNSDRLATLAVETDPNSSEALQTLASVRVSQNRPEEAKQYAERAWERWKDLDPGKFLNKSHQPTQSQST